MTDLTYVALERALNERNHLKAVNAELIAVLQKYQARYHGAEHAKELWNRAQKVIDAAKTKIKTCPFCGVIPDLREEDQMVFHPKMFPTPCVLELRKYTVTAWNDRYATTKTIQR